MPHEATQVVTRHLQQVPGEWALPSLDALMLPEVAGSLAATPTAHELTGPPRCRTPRNLPVPLPELLPTPPDAPPALPAVARPQFRPRPAILQPAPTFPPFSSSGGLGLELVREHRPKLHLRAGATGLRWLECFLGTKLPYAPLANAAVDFDVVDLPGFAAELEGAAAQVINAPRSPAAPGVCGPDQDVRLLCHAGLADGLLCDFEQVALQRSDVAKELRRALGHQSVARRAFLAQLQPSQPQELLDLMNYGSADWRRDVLQLTQRSTMDLIFAAVCNSRALEVRAWGLPVVLGPGARTERLLFVDGLERDRLHLRLAWVHAGGASWPVRNGNAPSPAADGASQIDVPGRGLVALGLRIERPSGSAWQSATASVTDVWLARDATLRGAPIDPTWAHAPGRGQPFG